MSKKRKSKIHKFNKRSTKNVKRANMHRSSTGRSSYSSPERDFDTLVKKFEFSINFTKKTESELSPFNQKHIDNQIRDRVDLTSELTVTIDGEDAKDFDDAISLRKEKLSGSNKEKFILGVHIADVSHYVTKDSYLDEEALKRGNSTYLINQVIPMLPFKLSDDLCSLVEGKKRLTLSCEIVINEKGEIEKYNLFKSCIQSSRRFNYEEVDKILGGKLDSGKQFKKLFSLCRELKDILHQKRKKSGSIDIEKLEPVFFLNERDLIEKVVIKQRLESERIIEEFMLVANQCAADFLLQHHTGVFRVHESPKEEKLLNFQRQVRLHQFKLDNKGSVNPLKKPGPNQYQLFLESIKDKKTKSLFSYLLLTSMNQAHYSETNIGHYGLAFSKYTHFTSPIRRYPDLIVHRLISKILLGKKTGYNNSLLSVIANQNSISERKSVDAEREYVKVKSVHYLANKIGEQFDCLITGIIPRGLFLMDTKTHIEGFVDGAWLGYKGYYDEKQSAYINNEQKLKMGDAVRAELVSVNIKKLFIDFKLLEEGSVK